MLNHKEVRFIEHTKEVQIVYLQCYTVVFSGRSRSVSLVHKRVAFRADVTYTVGLQEMESDHVTGAAFVDSAATVLHIIYIRVNSWISRLEDGEWLHPLVRPSVPVVRWHRL